MRCSDLGILSRRAIADQVWRAVQTQTIPEMPYTVDGIPLAVLSSWTEVAPALTALPRGFARGMMFPYRLSKLAEMVSARPLMPVFHLAEEGKAQEREESLRLQIFKAKVAMLKRGKGHKGADREAAKTHESARAVEAPARLLELERAREAAREQMFGQEADANAQTAAATNVNSHSEVHMGLLRKSALGSARILHSRSAKLNFILNEVSGAFFTRSTGVNGVLPGHQIQLRRQVLDILEVATHARAYLGCVESCSHQVHLVHQ